MKKKTIVTLARQMQEAMTTSERNDGTKYHHLQDDHPAWMQEVVHNAHGDKLPDDTTYRFLSDALDLIYELDDKATEDDIREAIFERIEADVYTSDLTAWLGARNDHVYYLTEALEESGITDGFQALMYAQKKHKEEVAFDLVSELEKIREAAE